MPIAISDMSSHTIGPRDTSMHTGDIMHGSVKKSGTRTLFFADHILTRQSSLKCSHRAAAVEKKSWSDVELMSISTLALRHASTVTRSSNGNACALRSVKLSG